MCNTRFFFFLLVLAALLVDFTTAFDGYGEGDFVDTCPDGLGLGLTVGLKEGNGEGEGDVRAADELGLGS